MAKRVGAPTRHSVDHGQPGAPASTHGFGSVSSEAIGSVGAVQFAHQLHPSLCLGRVVGAFCRNGGGRACR